MVGVLAPNGAGVREELGESGRWADCDGLRVFWVRSSFLFWGSFRGRWDLSGGHSGPTKNGIMVNVYQKRLPEGEIS